MLVKYKKKARDLAEEKAQREQEAKKKAEKER